VKHPPAEICGRNPPTPIAVVSGVFRRAWARFVERRIGGRRMLEDAMKLPGGLNGLLAQHDVHRGERTDTPHRVFRAPGLAVDPTAFRQPVHGSRSAFSAIYGGPGMEHSSRLFKPLR